MEQFSAQPGTRYRVCVQRILDEGWIRALHVRALATHRYYTASPCTVLTLELADQAELLGLLNRLHNLGLTVLSVEMNARSGPSSGFDDEHGEL
jgi:plasmid stability protein